MLCTKCNNQGIENQANGSTFWYCRTCKDEIQLTVNPSLESILGEGLRAGAALKEIESMAVHPAGLYITSGATNAAGVADSINQAFTSFVADQGCLPSYISLCDTDFIALLKFHPGMQFFTCIDLNVFKFYPVEVKNRGHI